MKVVLLSVFVLLVTGCEGVKLTGSMCDSLQPGEVSTQCRTYSEEEAKQATEHKVNEEGACLECQKAEKIEIRQ